jgi:hypothetical protein
MRQVKVAKTAPEPFCDFRRLWYDPYYKFSVLRGWRHGVRSRSLVHFHKTDTDFWAGPG